METNIQKILPFNGKSIIKPRKLSIKEYELIRESCCSASFGCFCLCFESLYYCEDLYKAAEKIFLKTKVDFDNRLQGRASEYIKQFWEEREGKCEQCEESFHRYMFKEDFLSSYQICEHCEKNYFDDGDEGFEEMPERLLEYMLDDVDKEDRECEEAWWDSEENLDKHLLDLMYFRDKTVRPNCPF